MGNLCKADTREADEKAAKERRQRELQARLKLIEELKEHLEAEGAIIPHTEEYVCNQNVLITKKALESVQFPDIPNSNKKYLAAVIAIIKKRMESCPIIPHIDGNPASTEPTNRQKPESVQERGFLGLFGGADEKNKQPVAAVDDGKRKIGDTCDPAKLLYERASTLTTLDINFSFTPEELEDAKSYGFFINRTEGYTYFGQFLEKKFHGKGRQVFEDGSTFEGWFIHGEKGPFGRLISKDGDFYIGEFYRGKPHGVGYFNDMMEVEYKGEFALGIRAGFGEERNSGSNSTYEGEFANDKKNGVGVMLWDDGTKYEGHFVENDFDGKGVYFWKDKRTYNGDWKRNMMHGTGLYTWKGGRYYKGGYAENKKSGFGEFFWSLGQKAYKGNWKNGLQDGAGVLTSPEGEVTIGEWKEGVLISVKIDENAPLKPNSSAVNSLPENESIINPSAVVPAENPSSDKKPAATPEAAPIPKK